ncbi:MAG: SRPBCC family protein [Pyrinomonadaceae bacterium]
MLFIKESVIRATPEVVFAFHELPDAFRRLMPPWEKGKIIQAAPDLRPGAQAIIETKVLGLLRFRWVAEHTRYDPPHLFEDIQIKGPFHAWRHTHFVKPHPDGALLRDQVEYQPPLGPLGRLMSPIIITPRLEKMFDYRHRVTREWCESQ